jgi:hypothetical protein
MSRRLVVSLLAAATLPALVSSAATIGGALPGPLPLFPPDNWWNVDVSAAPRDPGSSGFIGFIGASKKLHPDFGGEAGPVEIYGIPYVVVDAGQPKRTVVFDYADESDGVDHDTGESFPFYPIPDEAISEPHYIEGGYPGEADVGGDRHMLIVDKDTRHLYELFALRWNGGAWEAGSGAFFDLTSNDRRPEGWTSADAAGLAILPGLVRYDEVFGPDEIKHAFRVTVRATNGYVFPASHRAGSTSGAPPLGARLRLKASKDLSPFPPALQKIFRAMKTYGLIVADNGSDMYVSGAFHPDWDNDVLNPAFHSLTAGDFEVVKLGWKPPPPTLSVSDASASEGDAGSVEAVFTVSLSPAHPVDVAVDYAVTPLTADPSDFTPASGTLVFPAGTTSLPVPVALQGDVLDEADETFLLTLSNAAGAALGDSQGIGTIVDDDPLPALSVAGATVTEGNAGHTIALVRVGLSAPSGRPVKVAYAAAPGSAASGSDFLPASGSVVFPVGTTSGELALAVVGDLRNESDESFTVNLKKPENGALAAAQAAVTILDDDEEPALSVGDVWIAEKHVGSRNAVFKVTLSAAAPADVDVEWTTADATALAGEDYAPGGGTLTIKKGSRSGTLKVAVLGDLVDERNEAFLLLLQNASGARIVDGLAQGVVWDDDGTPDAYTPIASLPYAATRAGRYRLVSDLAFPQASGAAITMRVGGVNLDLEGHVLEGTAGAGTLAFGVLARNRAKVTVQNGAVQGFLAGVFLAGPPPYTSNQGLVVRSLRAAFNTYAGIWLEGRGNLVEGSEMRGTGGTTALGEGAGAVGLASVGPLPKLADNQVIDTFASDGGDAFAIAASGAVKGLFSGNLVKNAVPAPTTGILVAGGTKASVTANTLETLDYGVVFASGATGTCQGNAMTAVVVPSLGVTCEP